MTEFQLRSLSIIEVAMSLPSCLVLDAFLSVLFVGVALLFKGTVVANRAEGQVTEALYQHC